MFLANRTFLLGSLHEDAPDLASVVGNADILEGYALGRRDCFADYVGPGMAGDGSSASELLEAFLACSSRQILVVERSKSHVADGGILIAAGFNCSRWLIPMYRESNVHPRRPELFYAIRSWEIA